MHANAAICPPVFSGLATASGFAFAELRDNRQDMDFAFTAERLRVFSDPPCDPNLYWYFSSRTAPRMAPRDR